MAVEPVALSIAHTRVDQGAIAVAISTKDPRPTVLIFDGLMEARDVSDAHLLHLLQAVNRDDGHCLCHAFKRTAYSVDREKRRRNWTSGPYRFPHSRRAPGQSVFEL